MKRIILSVILLLIPFNVYAEDACWQEARLTAPFLSGSVTAPTNYCNDGSIAGCWYMNVDDDTEPDRSSAGNDLTKSTGDTINRSATVPSGYNGYSRDFDSANVEYLYNSAEGTELDISGGNATITIVAWIRPDSAPASGATRCVAGKYNHLTNNRQYFLGVKDSDGGTHFKIRAVISDDGTNVNGTDGSTEMSATNWYHIAMVYNDTDLRVYLNGSLDCTAGVSCLAENRGIADKSQEFTVGAYAGGQQWDGLIDEVAVFSRALSATEINNIWANGLTGNKGGYD